MIDIVLTLIVLTILMVVWTILGIIGAKWVKSMSDYFLAGQRMSIALLTITILAAWESHYTVLAGGEAGYRYGLVGPIWYAVAVGGALIVLAVFAARIKQATPSGTISFPQFLRYRFSNAKVGNVNLFEQFTAWEILIIVTLSAASSTLGGAYVLQALTGMNFDISLLIAGIFYIVYSIYGGLYAVALVDVMQLGMIAILLPIVALYVSSSLGGIEGITTGLMKNAPELLGLTSASVTWMYTFFLSLLGGTLAAPFLWQMIYASRNPRHAQISLVLSGIFFMPVALVCGFIGLAGRATGLNITPSAASPQVVANVLPPSLGLVYLLGFVAAAWSTFAANVNGNAAILMANVIAPYFLKEKSESKNLLVSRVVALIFGLLTIVIAKYAPGILWLLMFSYALRTPPVIPALIGLYTRRLGSWGAFTAALLGFIGSAIIYLYNSFYGTIAAWVIPIVVSLVFIIIGGEK
jgi:SSS family solute:Na+ symporter